MTTSYIVFDGAPTVAECLASWDYVPSPSHWVTTVAPCHPPGSTSTPSPPLSPANTSARYADASSTELVEAPDEELGGTDLYANNVFGDASLLAPEETPSRMDSDSDDEDDSQLLTGTLPVLGPSGYSLVSQQQSQFRQTQFNDGESTYGGMSYGDEEASFIGAPPKYEWRTSQLTELSKLRGLMEGWSKYAKRRVSILAVIRSFDRPKEVKAGLWIAKWYLEDASGGTLTLVMWGETARDWSEVMQMGDVVYVGDITLKLHEGIIEGTPNTERSALQICFRTLKFKEEDEGFRFRPEHAEYSAQAERVLGVVKYYEDAYPVKDAAR